MKFRFSYFLSAFAALAVMAAVGCGPAPVEQPIAFNHLIHKEADITCDVCHTRYTESKVSGRPELETCMFCHEEALTDSVEEEKIRQYASEGTEIPWNRIYSLPDHVYYSHRRHVVVAGLECQSCHGNQGESTTPQTRPAVNHTMERCIDCHEENEASTACNSCHR